MLKAEKTLGTRLADASLHIETWTLDIGCQGLLENQNGGQKTWTVLKLVRLLMRRGGAYKVSMTKAKKFH